MDNGVLVLCCVLVAMVALSVLASLTALVDFSKPSLYVCLVSIGASPLGWNLIGRNEYKHRTLTKLIGARLSCTILGIAIFFAGLLRDVLYRIELHDQPQYSLPHFLQTVIAWIIFGIGNFLVTISFLRLGFYGTFCGDYFGIIKSQRVVSFPYNIMENPMLAPKCASLALQFGMNVRRACLFHFTFTWYIPWRCTSKGHSRT